MADVSNFIANHPPALKVGGRRHSISTRHRSHPPPDSVSPTTPPAVVEPVDYPRPAPPPPAVGGEAEAEAEAVHVPPPQHNEEEPQKKDKRHENERKLMELAQRKAEMTRPTRDSKNNGKGFGAAGRIAQPMKPMRI
ncbi:hypothetical protein C8F04DRAFT_1249637 [Mycena alexandri]|uniref:Uncharacterized protein n=1 Tax=Mycena alexandri TaxID=1745969 RepID=A0AAD6TFR3_9AGAR|nr:hypothetical protein C8F04DRAFT_1249637 [Mycena alexandri]